MNIQPYFGMTRTGYLQALCNRFGDFHVSWNWFNTESQAWEFTKRRSVMQLWEEPHNHPTESRLEKVQHRQAMPIELFVELDDGDAVSHVKLQHCLDWCEHNNKPYCVYKSRKGYHISVLIGKHSRDKKRYLLRYFQADMQFESPKATWSLEWSSHWKQPDFIIHPIKIHPKYEHTLLGYDTTT